MKFLLDTHILMWTLAGDPRLSERAAGFINQDDAEIYYSVVSPWETEIKHQLHPEIMKLSGAQLIQYCEEAGFLPLPIVNRHTLMLPTLQRRENAPLHKDPFDRIMLAQAKADEMFFLTHDHLLPDYQEKFIIYV